MHLVGFTIEIIWRCTAMWTSDSAPYFVILWKRLKPCSTNPTSTVTVSNVLSPRQRNSLNVRVKIGLYSSCQCNIHDTLINCQFSCAILTFWRRNYFFLILAHPVYKMWIIQEPNTLKLWNKLHFEERKKRRVYTMFKIFGTYTFVE